MPCANGSVATVESPSFLRVNGHPASSSRLPSVAIRSWTCLCAVCEGWAQSGRGSSGSSAAPSGAATGAQQPPQPPAAPPPPGGDAAGGADSSQQQRQNAARRQQQCWARRRVLHSVVFGPDPRPVGSLVAPVDGRLPAATVLCLLEEGEKKGEEEEGLCYQKRTRRLQTDEVRRAVDARLRASARAPASSRPVTISCPEP